MQKKIIAIVIILLLFTYCGEKQQKTLLMSPSGKKAKVITNKTIPKITPSKDYKQNLEPIKNIVSQYVKVRADKINYDTPLMSKEIGLEDLDIIEIILELEETFDTPIPDEDLSDDSGNLLSNINIEIFAKVVAKHAKN